MLPHARCLLLLGALFLLESPATTQLPADAPANSILRRGPTDERRLALIFTAHEFAENATLILDSLLAHQLKASFFLTGEFLANPTFRSITRRILREGHYVGPHSDRHLLYCSWTSPPQLLVARSQFQTDLEANLDKITRLGVPRPRFFLPPFEHANDDIAEWTRASGLALVNYTPGTRSHADYTLDHAPNFTSSQQILDSILRHEQTDPRGLNGFLLLFHLGAGPQRSDPFAKRLPELLDFLRQHEYACVRLDQLLPTPPPPATYLRAHQLGYRPSDRKLAIALGQGPLPRNFRVLDAHTDREVWRGTVRPLPDSHWGAFSRHAELDFSRLRRPGRYLLSLADVRSLPFTIGPSVGCDLPDQLLEFMRQQRCGYNPWLDTPCHQLDGRTAYGPLPHGTPIDVTGGWHDAGDLLKYHLTSGNATAQLLLAWLLSNPQPNPHPLFPDRVDAAGRPTPNGIPDLLDEARWGLDWMLKMNPAPGQLYHQVADDRDHIGLRLPQNEIADYGWGKGGARVVYAATGSPQGLGPYPSVATGVANLAGRYAAAMALAYQTWKDHPAERAFAERCLRAGREVYQLGRAQPGFQQGNSFRAPYRYEETTWADDMEWGAAELFRATGETRYRDEAQDYAVLAGAESWMGLEQAAHYRFYPFMNLGHYRLHDVAEPAFRPRLAAFYQEGLERCVAAARTHPYGIGVPSIWCSNNLLVALTTQCLLYERMTGRAGYRAFATRHRDWLFGRNPWGYTMFTEIGAVFPTQIHLMTTHLTGRSVRGGLVDGPVYERIFRSLRGVSITQPDPLAPFQDPRAVYHNDFHDYATNEPTMDGTASAILLTTLLSTWP